MAPPKEKSNLETKVEQELDDLLASLGSEVTTVKLYRIEGGKQQALATYTPSELAANPEEIIGGEYGPGRYLVRAVLPTLPGKPGNRWGPSKVIDLAEDSQYVQSYLRKHATDPEPVNQGDPWFRMMELQFKTAEARNSDLQRAIAEQNKQFHELILAMIAGNKNGGGDIASLIAGVRDLKALSDGTGNGSRLNDLKELLEIASLIPGGGDESPWSTVAKVVAAGIARGHNAEAPAGAAPQKLIETTATTAKTATEKDQGPSPASAIPPVESPKPAMTADNAKPDDVSSRPVLLLIDRLKTKAEKGRDPELWADWTIEQADDEQDPETIALVDGLNKSESFTAWWAVFLPERKISPHFPAIRVWWETFYQRVREVIQENAPAAGARGAS